MPLPSLHALPLLSPPVPTAGLEDSLQGMALKQLVHSDPSLIEEVCSYATQLKVLSNAAPVLQGLEKPCNTVVTRSEALQQPGKHTPVSQMLQVLVDRSRCLHMCAEFPRQNMSNSYQLKYNAYPELPPAAPKPASIASSDCCVVTMVEGMSGPKNAEYLSPLREILAQCRHAGVDLVVYTDAPLPEMEQEMDKVGGRGLFVRYLQDLRVETESGTMSVDEMIERSKQERAKNLPSLKPSSEWAVLHGRIDYVKMLITREAAAGKWRYVGYQDCGKVAPIAHYLRDSQARRLVDKFGILQSAGSLPENYAWITSPAVHGSWVHAVRALTEFFLAPPKHTAVQFSDMSHFSTLGTLAVRQHIVYMQCPAPPQLGAGPEQILRLGAMNDVMEIAGGIMPCNNTFVNSKSDIQIALAVENLSCSSFSNMIMTEQKVYVTQRIVCMLHRQSMLQAQEDIAGDAPYVQCAENVLTQVLDTFATPRRMSYGNGSSERFQAKRMRLDAQERAYGTPGTATTVAGVEPF